MSDAWDGINSEVVKAIQERVDAERRIAFQNSPQLSLGQIIEKLEAIKDQETTTQYDFEYAYPTELDSWRGSYAELALGFGLEGYGLGGSEHFATAFKKNVHELTKHLKSAIGKTFEGWKGGNYVMSEDTPVWVANPGNSGNTAIVGVSDHKYVVVLDTAYCEFT